MQKPRRKTKARDHLIALERRLKLWDEGSINELVDESTEIQKRLPSTNTSMNLQKISMKFKHLMQKGNAIGALWLLTNNMSNGILPLTDETLHLLHTKHPRMQNACEKILLQEPIKQVYPVIENAIDKTLISKSALKQGVAAAHHGLTLAKNLGLQIIWIFFLGPPKIVCELHQNTLHQKFKYIN